MELRKTATACLAAVILTAGSAAFAQSGTGNTGNPSNDPATIQDPGMAPAGQGAGVSGGTGNTGNPTNDPALLQQDVTGSTTGNGTTGGTGSTGNQTNDPAAIQSNGGSPCPSGTAQTKSASGQMVCQ